MQKRLWGRWATLVAAGAVLLQTPSCVETATVVSSIAQVITAGGVMYLVGRVLE